MKHSFLPRFSYRALTLAFTAFAAGLSPLRADLIYGTGGPDNQDVFHSDFDNSAPAGPRQAGDTFSLTSSGIATSVQWWGGYAYNNNTFPATDNFTIRLFLVTLGMPSTTPFFELNIGNNVTRTDVGPGFLGFEQFMMSAALPNVSLSAGSSYLISIVGNSAGHTNDWFWSTHDATAGDARVRDLDGSAWSGSQGEQLAFNIQGTIVPEPSTWALLIAGLAVLAIRRSSKPTKDVA